MTKNSIFRLSWPKQTHPPNKLHKRRSTGTSNPAPIQIIVTDTDVNPNLHTMARIPSNPPAVKELCKPEPDHTEDWQRPKPLEAELIVPEDCAAGKNLDNPKVLYLLGITEILRFDMVTSEQKVILAK